MIRWTSILHISRTSVAEGNPKASLIIATVTQKLDILLCILRYMYIAIVCGEGQQPIISIKLQASLMLSLYVLLFTINARAIKIGYV